MSQVIFCRTRWHYDSYIHFWKLVELSKFPTCYVDEIDWGLDNVYIVSPINGELPSPLPTRNCKIIWWNIEREGCYPPEKFGEFDEVWCSDKGISERHGAKFVVLGSHQKLGYYTAFKRCTVTTNCYETPRRTLIFNELRKDAWTFAPNSFDIPDHEFAASRLQVLPQQDGAAPQTVTPLRFAIAAAYKMPLVYELEHSDPFPFVDQEHFVRTNYRHLIPAAKDTLKRTDRQEIGDNLHDLLCVKTNFRCSVDENL